MYKSQFQKMVPYDWFCGPGHICGKNIIHKYFFFNGCLFIYLDRLVALAFHTKRACFEV